MHKKASLPAGCVKTLISNMCQESDSSRPARGELWHRSGGGFTCLAIGPGSGDEREARQGRGGENVLRKSTLCPGVEALSVFLNSVAIMGIQRSDPAATTPPPSTDSLPSPTLLDSITGRVSTATSGEDVDKSFCSVSS